MAHTKSLFYHTLCNAYTHNISLFRAANVGIRNGGVPPQETEPPNHNNPNEISIIHSSEAVSAAQTKPNHYITSVANVARK